jgi:2'-5' RNA ligase
MRLFFALWPPPGTAQGLRRWAEACDGKRTAVEKIHLTLAFLGEADPQRAIGAAQRVQAEAFDLPMEVGQYWKRNQIVWAGPQETPAPLQTLVERLQFQLFREAFVLERRPFAAHVTLVRRAHPPAALPALPPLEWPVGEFLLIRSDLARGGSAYEPIARFPLSSS